MDELRRKAIDIRCDIVDMIYNAKSGHFGGSLSCVDILTVIYHKHITSKDKFILSKGHAAPAYYATLASVNILDKKLLNSLRNINSMLEGHPSNKIPGVDVSSGSLGQGLSIANGMGIAKMVDKEEGYIYVVLGDGEMEEGQIWEAFMTMHKYNITNVIPIIDNNGLQIDGSIEQVKGLINLKEMITSFGIKVVECNGNDIEEIDKSIIECKESNIASCIIAKTIKGKGISFMENDYTWHGKTIKEDEYIQAKGELN